MKKNKKVYALIFFIIAFICNTIFVTLDKYHAVDSFVHNLLLKGYSETMTKAMHIFTFFGCTLFIVSLSAVIFFICIFKKNYGKAISTASMIALSTILNNVVKFIVRRPRPLYMMITESTTSYPSGHTMAATTLYGFLIYLLINSNLNKKEKIIYSGVLVLMIMLVATSRMYLGAHFFSDILGASLLSIIMIITFSIINDKKHFIKW